MQRKIFQAHLIARQHKNMSEKKRDQAVAQRSSSLRFSLLFHRIRDRIIANCHSAASSLATSTIPKSLSTQTTTVQSTKWCKSFNRKRIELFHQRFVHRFRQFRWKFSEFLRRYTVSILHCFAIRAASTLGLFEGNKHEIQCVGVCVCGGVHSVSFFRFKVRTKKTKQNYAFRRVS